jgi:hypothetical protein
MKKKRKHHNKAKSVSRLLIGSSYSFEVEDPLKDYPEIKNTSYGHENSFKRVIMNQNLRGIKNAFDHMKMKWLASIEVRFQNGTEAYSKTAEIVWFGMLHDCGNEYQQTIEQIFEKANMKHYMTCAVKVQVIGINEIQDDDFSITKSESI